MTDHGSAGGQDSELQVCSGEQQEGAGQPAMKG